jgi:hypothetical protein
MEEARVDIPFLGPEEKVVGHAYLTVDGEIVFAPHSGASEVVLVEAQSGTKGPWAVRLRPAARAPIKSRAKINPAGSLQST